MKDIKLIEIKMPNGIKVEAIVIETIANYSLCYAQNRLFLVYECTLSIIVEYCIIPEYDAILFEYYNGRK